MILFIFNFDDHIIKSIMKNKKFLIYLLIISFIFIIPMLYRPLETVKNPFDYKFIIFEIVMIN